MVAFEPSQTEFDSLKAQFLENYATYLKMPANYGKELRLWLMENTRNDAFERMAAFNSVTLDDMIAFVKELRQGAWCQMQVEGNFYEREARSLFDSALTKLDVKQSQRDSPIRTARIQGSSLVKMESLHNDDKRSEFIVYWQAGAMSIKEYSTMDLLISIMEEPAFDFLRTKKTLGYTVFPMVRCTYGIIGASITVRSQIDKFTAEQVYAAICEFLTMFKEQLKKMKPADFKDYQTGLIELKSQDDNKLKEIVSRNYAEMSSEDYKFDRLETEIWHLERMKKKDVVHCFDKFIEKNENRLIMAVEGIREERAATDQLNQVYLKPQGDEFKGFEPIADLARFRADLSYFEVAKLNE